jgi:hypothetical protein
MTDFLGQQLSNYVCRLRWNFESMHLRQVDIEQNQIRLQFVGLPNGLQPIRRLDGPELRLLKRRANEMAERRMVLDDENPQRHLEESS